MARFRSSRCKADCGGHRAGYAYAIGGGRQPSKYSSSFNTGLRIGIKAVKQRRKRKRK
jgi:hypothetical protein